jgi:hypothetical protein
MSKMYKIGDAVYINPSSKHYPQGTDSDGLPLEGKVTHHTNNSSEGYYYRVEWSDG